MNLQVILDAFAAYVARRKGELLREGFASNCMDDLHYARGREVELTETYRAFKSIVKKAITGEDEED